MPRHPVALMAVGLALATLPAAAQPSPVQDAYLAPPGASYFGVSAAFSGERALIGSVTEAAGGTFAGAAYVFVRTDSGWEQEARLVAPDGPGYYGFFGFAVALSGDRAFVTDHSYRDGYRRGAVHVFVRSGATWTYEARLLHPDPFRIFGQSVSASGDRILVGSIKENFGLGFSGVAHVFSRSGAAWSREATLQAEDFVEGDLFGASVSLLGDRALVGATGVDAPELLYAGAAYVFSSLSPTSTDAGPAVHATLSTPFPNPATRRASERVALDAPQHVRASVVDALGREVAILFDAEAMGSLRLDVDTAALAPGVYVVRVSGTGFAETRRLTVVR